MASQFEAGAAWTIRRLRSPDAAYLTGAVRAARPAPPPVAIATGPNAQTNAGAVGATEYWVLDTTLPAQDLCWVVVQGHPLVQDDTTPGQITQVYWYPQGNNAIGEALTPPALGPGGDLVEHLVASAGTFVHANQSKNPTAASVWLPLDPSNTLAGVATTLVVKAGTPGFGIGEVRANLTHCRMLGYPLTLWDSGALWEPLAQRGT